MEIMTFKFSLSMFFFEGTLSMLSWRNRKKTVKRAHTVLVNHIFFAWAHLCGLIEKNILLPFAKRRYVVNIGIHISCTNKIILLPPFLYTRPIRFSCQTLTYNLVNKIWVICHQKYIIGNFFQMCIQWHTSCGIQFTFCW